MTSYHSRNPPVVEQVSQDLRSVIQQHQAFQMEVLDKLVAISEKQTQFEARVSELEKLCKAGYEGSQASGVEKRKRVVKRSLSVCYRNRSNGSVLRKSCTILLLIVYYKTLQNLVSLAHNNIEKKFRPQER